MSLDAGQHAAVREFAQDVETRQMQLQDIEARLAWRQGYLLFHGDPLSVVLQEVSRYTRARIEADPGIRDTVVSGYFRAGDIDGLLVAMQENFQIDARREGDDRIVLTPRP